MLTRCRFPLWWQLLIGLTFVVAARARPIEIEDLFRFHRISDPQISPDGRHVAYVQTEVLKSDNRTNSHLWVLDVDPATGVPTSAPRQMTNSAHSDLHPRWSPDGRWIAFESSRTGTVQIYLLPARGGEARQLTTLFTGASQPVWSPDGKALAFVSSVYAEFSSRPFAEAEKLNHQKQDAIDQSKMKVRVFEHLLYRHWDSWVEGKRQHLFVVSVNADGSATSAPRDVTPGDNDGVPTADTFSAGDDYAFSPDGTEITTTAPPLPIREQAWSTNYDLWTINLRSGERTNVTAQNPAADGFPRYSPDGRYLAYRAQAVPGFESDRWQLWLIDRATGQRRSLTANWDRWVNHFTWAPDSRSIYLETEENGLDPVYTLSLSTGAITPLITSGSNSDVVAAANGRWLAFTHSQLTAPMEVDGLRLGDSRARTIVDPNAELRSKIEFTPPESLTVSGDGGVPVQMWIVKPPHFDVTKRHPLVFWVHGGPQGSWNDGWSTRWNPEVWAAQGYVLAMPNPRGSTGFGQEFVNGISRDWAGKVFTDLMACLTFMKQQPYVDPARMAAAGASYGGYMMYWFEGHVPDFRCIVAHDGTYNFDSMYGTTDEVWFDEHEHGQPWSAPDFDRFSPHKYAANFTTPMLIIHNDLDFRVPISEGMQAFTVLQRKGIPSKLVMFPEEGHWVLKPQDSEFWHRTIFEWLKEYLR